MRELIDNALVGIVLLLIAAIAIAQLSMRGQCDASQPQCAASADK